VKLISRKYTSPIWAGKRIICLFLLFCSLHTHIQAQVATDTLEGTIAPPPPVDDNVIIEETSADHQKKKSFLAKYEFDSLSIYQRQIPDSVMKRMKEDDAFWYMKKVFKKGIKKDDGSTVPPRTVPDKTNKPKKVPEKEEASEADEYKPAARRSWAQSLIWVLILVGFVGVIAWYLGGSKIGLFRKKTKVVKTDSHEEEIPEDIFAINYQKEIDRAASEGNFRLAIRLMFLRLLKNMAEKNIINYKQDKTNLDYLLQLQPTSYYTGFFSLTRNYEYSWYGKFQVSEEAYKIIRNDFEQFERTLH
jgi:hypothetical protein